MMTDEEIARLIYDRTSLYACLCFDNPEQIRKAQSFLCLLFKRGVIKITGEQQLEFDFDKSV